MTEDEILLVKSNAAQIANIIKSTPPHLVQAVQMHFMIIMKQHNPDPLIIDGGGLVTEIAEPQAEASAVETPAEDQTESP